MLNAHARYSTHRCIYYEFHITPTAHLHNLYTTQAFLYIDIAIIASNFEKLF